MDGFVTPFWAVFLFSTALSYPVESSPVDDGGLTNRILGGYETSIDKFPYQLALEGGGRHFCGGSILTVYWALTAAHCVHNQPLKWLKFRAGSSVRGRGGTLHSAKSYITHEQYDRVTLDYDVALVRVGEPFNLHSSTSPMSVSLPLKASRGNEKVTASGWGFLQSALLKKPRQLVAVDILTTSWEECRRIYPGVTPRMLCAGDKERDICDGDSGGPLVRVGRGGNMEQVGLVSWAYGCGDGWPSVYTNLSTVTPWIVAVIGVQDDVIVFPSD